MPNIKTTKCPCCKGQKYLFVLDAAFPDEPPQRFLCVHCGETGRKEIQPEYEDTEWIAMWAAPFDYPKS